MFFLRRCNGNLFRRISLLLGFVMVLHYGARGQFRPGHLVTTKDLETLKQVIYMRLSPDGNWLAYVLEDGDLWLLSTHPGRSRRKMFHGTVPMWSPDSRKLAYYSVKSGTLQLWVFKLDTEKSEQVTRLPGGIDPDPSTRFSGWSYDMLRYAWSPDGKQILFCSRIRVPDEDRTTSSGNTRPEKIGTEATHPLILTDTTPPEWTLQGVFRSGGFVPHRINEKGSVASGANKNEALLSPRVNQILLVDVDAKVLRQLTKDHDLYFNPEWSPDGHEITCGSGEGHSLVGGGTGTTNIYAIDATTGEKKPLTRGPGVKRLPRYSHDGKLVAFLAGESFGAESVYVVSPKGGQTQNITARLNRHVTEFEWAVDDGSLVVVYKDGISWPIAQVKIANGDPHVLDSGVAAVRRCLTVSKTGKVAWQQSDPLQEGAIYVLAGTATFPYILMDINPQIRTWQLGTQEIVRWQNRHGDELEGILIKPAGYREGTQYPLIVDCYPGTANGFKGNTMSGNQALASAGYAVFYPNPRAPHVWINTFKTEAYDHAAMGPKGWDVTFDDVMSGVDELIRRGIVDPNRMSLYGFSNGAAVVDQLITRTARFKCAVSVAAALSIDWAGPFFLMTANPIIPRIAGSTPWESPQSYLALSALYEVDHISTPLLMADGDDDGLILLTDIELYNGLRWFNKDVTFLRYPHQGHGFEGTALTDFDNRREVFLERYSK